MRGVSIEGTTARRARSAADRSLATQAESVPSAAYLHCDAAQTGPQRRTHPTGDTRLFERSDALHADAGAVIGPAIRPPTRREVLAASIAAVSVEHWGAQRLLLRNGVYVTGFAIVWNEPPAVDS